MLALERCDVVGPEPLHREHVLARDGPALAHRDAVVGELVLVPAEPDAEHEAPAAQVVERRDRLRGHDRLPLGHEADPGAEGDAIGDRGRRRERHQRVEGALVLLAQLVVAGRRRRAPGDRDVGVLGEVERREAALLRGARERDGIHRLVGREHRHPEAHGGYGTPSMGICEGRVVIVTGAGRGIGRGHALEFARQGAKVVVNDLGAELDGSGGSTGPAGEVVDEIRAAGGEAVANGDDVADWDGAQAIVRTALDAFGGLDVVVNNAGFLRDRMFVGTSEDEWDAVIRVHLKGHFCVSRFAGAYWREQTKAGAPVDARIVNTSSGAGLLGSVGQGAYSAAKAGIAALTLVEAAELGRYGVTANAIAPAARTRMTEAVFAETMAKPDEGFDVMAPENVAPLVVWLGSADSKDVTGRVFEVEGGILSVADGWQHGPKVDRGRRWEPAEIGAAVRDLLARGAGAGTGLRRVGSVPRHERVVAATAR